MSILHTYHSKLPFRNVKGKPSITVSSKGISNGLSDIYNDGADFGPDTLLNATYPNQYGPPYTQTSGIQEAYNYGKIKYNNNWTSVFTIVLGEGVFVLNNDVNLSIGQSATDTSRPQAVNITGQGIRSTMVLVNQPNLNGIVLSIPNSNYGAEDITFSHFAIDIPYAPSPPYGLTSWGSTKINAIASNPTGKGANSAISYLSYGNGGQGGQFILNNIHLFTGNWNDGYGPTNGGLYVWGVENVIATNSTFGGDRALALIGSNTALAGGSSNYDSQLYATFYGCYVGFTYNSYITGYNVSIIGSNVEGNINLNYNSTTQGLRTNLSIEKSTMAAQLDLTDATVDFINLNNVNISGNYYPKYNAIIGSASPVNANQLILKNIAYWYSGLPNLLYNVNFSEYYIEGFNNINSNAITLPTQSTTSGTTAGTVKMDAVTYRTSYKKYVITFSGYENDTTTNQTISFPLSFSSYAVISANNTGLTISASTSGITITAPNSTATYSGIVIVEGY